MMLRTAAKGLACLALLTMSLPASAAGPLPDIALTPFVDQNVVVDKSDGTTVTGRLLRFDDQHAVLLGDDGTVFVVARSELTGLGLLQDGPAPKPQPRPAPVDDVVVDDFDDFEFDDDLDDDLGFDDDIVGSDDLLVGTVPVEYTRLSEQVGRQHFWGLSWLGAIPLVMAPAINLTVAITRPTTLGAAVWYYGPAALMDFTFGIGGGFVFGLQNVMHLNLAAALEAGDLDLALQQAHALPSSHIRNGIINCAMGVTVVAGLRLYGVLAEDPLGPIIVGSIMRPFAWGYVGQGIADFALGIPFSHKDLRAVEALESLVVAPVVTPDVRGAQLALRF